MRHIQKECNWRSKVSIKIQLDRRSPIIPLSSQQKVSNVVQQAIHRTHEPSRDDSIASQVHLACPSRTCMEVEASRTFALSLITRSLLILRSQRQENGHPSRLRHGTTRSTRRKLKARTHCYAPPPSSPRRSSRTPALDISSAQY